MLLNVITYIGIVITVKIKIVFIASQMFISHWNINNKKEFSCDLSVFIIMNSHVG